MGFFTAPAIAQSSTNGGGDPAQFISLKDAVDLGKQTERYLAANGARVAMVFRMAEVAEKMPEGIRYGHGSFWVYQRIKDESGNEFFGYTSNNLYINSENPEASYLKTDFPLDFTRPSKVAEVGVIIPTPSLQKRILEAMIDGDYEALHRADYSLVSNPHDIKYQNCNEFMLDVIASSLWETTDIERLKMNLKAHFDPAPVKAGALKRFFAPILRKNIKTDDHKGKIKTTTFKTLAEFLTTNGYAQTIHTLTLKDEAKGETAQ